MTRVRRNVHIGALIVALVATLLVAPFFTSGPAVGASPAKSKKSAVKWVLAISVDGLNPEALRVLGPSRAPNFYRLMAEGAYTLNARSEYESTSTLPNHTGMVTGRPVHLARGGHGVDFNEDNGSTVQQTDGQRVRSVFSAVHKKLGRTALFAGKPKFDLLKRSWPTSIDRYIRLGDNDELTSELLKDLKVRRKFRFLHLSALDGAGHAYGWLSDPYLDAVAETDRRLGRIMNKIDRTKRLGKHMVLLLTADHGGKGPTHYDPTVYADYRIPFFVWGRGVRHGDLYAINPRYADPGTARTNYAGKQPIRNGDIANLVTKLLGIKPVPGSRIGVKQQFNVYPR